MKINIIFAMVCLGVLGFFMLSRGGVAPTPPALQEGATDLQAAIVQAKAEGKIVFAVASADWCAPCQSYKRGALVDSNVAQWLDDNAITVSIDVTDTNAPNPDAQALGVSCIPATFVLNQEGQLVSRTTGAMNAGDLLAFLDRAAPR